MSAAAPGTEPTQPPIWTPDPGRWGRWDLVAILVWIGGLTAFFWKAVALRQALFYFDITEINYPYRDFLAGELRAGRFSRWFPGLYHGLPLFAESQAGYLHPLKFVLYPWLATWQALNLDTVGSIALTGLGMYGWMRRHVGPAGAATAAVVFGLSGFVWAHLIHTSMNNALISVPLVFWATEVSWDGGRLRGIALGALALACQVFAGHLQDTILTLGALGLYTLYRASTAPTWRARASVLALATALVVVGVAVAAVQWVPSKNLLDRSPRVGGLTWDQITYGSWSPELLPTLVVREAYGTLPRDTDWLDGYYPYHEMNAYMGIISLALAVIGAGAWRDRWVGFWVVLAGAGGLFMLGRYTALFDYMNLVPVIGSSRIPVRYHLWVSLAVAVLAAVGVDLLGRLGLAPVRLRGVAWGGTVLIIASFSIATVRYIPAWTEARRWTAPEFQEHFRWLGTDIAIGVIRTSVLVGLAWWVISSAARSVKPARRVWLAACLPALVMLDLLGSHWWDVPTIDPSYWTVPPASAQRIQADPATIRVYGLAEKSSAEPGFASRPVNFFEVRDTLAWSIAPVWGLKSSAGLTPIFPRRVLTFTDHATPPSTRYDVEGVSHLLAGRALPGFTGRTETAGSAVIHFLTTAQPRARLMGRPAYVADELAAGQALTTLGKSIHDRIIVEDPDRPVPDAAEPAGSARITRDDPEHVEIQAENTGTTPIYLVLTDTFDPGWSCLVDGQPTPIRPAFAAFRAVVLRPGLHKVEFMYEPAGFRVGLGLTGVGLLSVVLGLVWSPRVGTIDPPHGPSAWPRWWFPVFAGLLILMVVGSGITRGPDGGLIIHPRWTNSFHRFTWAAGIEAIRPMSSALGR